MCFDVQRQQSVFLATVFWQSYIDCLVDSALGNKQTIEIVIGFAVGVAATIFISYLCACHTANPVIQPLLNTTEEYERSIRELISSHIKGEKIIENLRALTTEPHVAGTEANHRVAETIANIWRANKLENVHFAEYDALLSYPDYDNPNTVEIVDSAGHISYKSDGVSKAILPDEQGAPGAGVRWVAYASNGTAQGDLVFCHQGTQQDFQYLKQQGIKVEGRIAVLRYGGGFRGNKVKNAALHGAIGAILYSDPADVAREGVDDDHVYPATEWMPSTAAQRGSIRESDGDPLTPIYPSKHYTYRTRTVQQAKDQHIIPTIPVLPMSYGDMQHLLSQMDGPSVPKEWQGGLNLTYRLGPGFIARDQQVRISVRSSLEQRTIRNVIGYIRGSQEPDRYIILGNHFDAWVYGSVDPNSGTAVLAEVGRAFTTVMQETGWRPSRTIIFCAWDAEEFGLIGSTEWLQEHTDLLARRAAVYINVDNICGNVTMHVSTVPSIYQAATEAAKKIANPMDSEKKAGRTTVYQTWVRSSPGKVRSRPDAPNMPVPSGGSDDATFLNYLGIPVINFKYENYTYHDNYPLYHTLYETISFNEKILDTNNFAVHVAVGQYWAELARMFADSPILPINASDYARMINEVYLPQLRDTLRGAESQSQLKIAFNQLEFVEEAATRFVAAADEFELSKVEAMNNFKMNSLALRQILRVNERLVAVDRCFVNPRGLPDSPTARHVLFAISEHDAYSGKVMPGIYDQFDDLRKAKTELERQAAVERLAQQISILQYSIECAINNLADII